MSNDSVRRFLKKKNVECFEIDLDLVMSTTPPCKISCELPETRFAKKTGVFLI